MLLLMIVQGHGTEEFLPTFCTGYTRYFRVFGPEVLFKMTQLFRFADSLPIIDVEKVLFTFLDWTDQNKVLVGNIFDMIFQMAYQTLLIEGFRAELTSKQPGSTYVLFFFRV